MKADEVYQFSAAQATLFDHRFPHFARGFAEVGYEQIAQRGHCTVVERQLIARRRTPLDLRLPIRALPDFAHQAKLGEPIEYEIVAPVGKLGEIADLAGATDFEEVGKGVIVALPFALEHHHADNSVAVGDIGNHLAIARLEDVKWYLHTGEQDEVGKGEDWNF